MKFQDLLVKLRKIQEQSNVFKDHQYSSSSYSERYSPEDQGSRKKTTVPRLNTTGTPRGQVAREEDKEVDVGGGYEKGTTTPHSQRLNTTGTLHGRMAREPAEDKEVDVGEQRRNDRQESVEEDGRTGNRGVGTRNRTRAGYEKGTTTPHNQRLNTTGTLHGRVEENKEIEEQRRNDRQESGEEDGHTGNRGVGTRNSRTRGGYEKGTATRNPQQQTVKRTPQLRRQQDDYEEEDNEDSDDGSDGYSNQRGAVMLGNKVRKNLY